MTVSRIVHPKYWFNSKVDNMFPTHLALLKVQHYLGTKLVLKALRYQPYLMKKNLTWKLPFSRSLCIKITNMFSNLL